MLRGGWPFDGLRERGRSPSMGSGNGGSAAPSTGSGSGVSGPFDRLRERNAAQGAEPQGTFFGTWRSLWVISSMETSRKVSTLALLTNRAGRYMSQTQASPIETS